MKDSLHEADRWLRQAENDLAFGRVALREGFFHQACFIAQQAGEKALKAVLYALGERIVLGHSLVELVGKLSEHFPDAAARREAAGVLDQYYVPTRYPNGLPGGVPFEAFGESQARAAVDEAARARGKSCRLPRCNGPGRPREARRHFDAFGLPNALIIDRDGVIRERFLGLVTRDQLLKELEPSL